MTSDKPELSIIVISYNTKEITKNCIDSILKSINDQISCELIIVDNNSTDGTVEYLKKCHAEFISASQSKNNKILKQVQDDNRNIVVKLIENKENTGFARANNQAVKEAKGEYILFLNSDTIILDHAIEKMFNFYKQNEGKIHFLGGKLLNKDLTPQPSCGPFYSLPVVFGALFLKGDYWGLTRYSPNKIKEVDWVSGACILTKKEYFNKLNGFDEKIFMYMDEIDLLYRAKKQNYRIFFYPEARLIHLASASSGGKTYPILQVYRGFLYFYKKHSSRLALSFLKILLKLKAVIALLIGRLTNNNYLIQTYEKALEIIKND